MTNKEFIEVTIELLSQYKKDNNLEEGWYSEHMESFNKWIDNKEGNIIRDTTLKIRENETNKK